MAARRAVNGHGGAGGQAGRGVLRQLQLEAGAARRHERHDLRGDAVLEVVRRQDLDRPRPRFDGRNELGGDRAEKGEKEKRRRETASPPILPHLCPPVEISVGVGHRPRNWPDGQVRR